MAKKSKKNMKGRPRGGASVPCPQCQADSRVVITRRGENGIVVRKRECKGRRTHHSFETQEVVV